MATDEKLRRKKRDGAGVIPGCGGDEIVSDKAIDENLDRAEVCLTAMEWRLSLIKRVIKILKLKDRWRWGGT